MKIMAMLMKDGRPASDVMQILAEDKEVVAQAYRNAKPGTPLPVWQRLNVSSVSWLETTWPRPQKAGKPVSQPRPPVSASD